MTIYNTETNIIIVDSQDKFDSAITWLETQSFLGFDCETTGLNPFTSEMLLFQIGNQLKQYVFDIARISKKYFKNIEIILENKNIVKIAHNAQFDYKMMKVIHDITISNVRCTMICEQLLTQGRSYTSDTDTDDSNKKKVKKLSVGLAAVLKKYFNVAMDKEERKTFVNMKFGNIFTQEQINYSALDVQYLVPLYKMLEQLLTSRDMKELLILEMEVLPVIADMSLNGIYLDKDKWLLLEQAAQEESEKAIKVLDKHFDKVLNENNGYDLFGNSILNYNSIKFIPWLNKLINNPYINITSTDAKYLEDFIDVHPVIGDLIAYRKTQKNITTYGKTFLDYISPVTGRIHSDFKQLVQTGRLSSDNPNLMNLPRKQEYRTPFCVQNPDWYFVSADFSGQELRLLAQASQEPQLIEALQKGIDLHTNSASLLFNVPYDSVTKEMRNKCKSITFGW